MIKCRVKGGKKLDVRNAQKMDQWKDNGSIYTHNIHRKIEINKLDIEWIHAFMDGNTYCNTCADASLTI